jgi:hypothetical protein
MGASQATQAFVEENQHQNHVLNTCTCGKNKLKGKGKSKSSSSMPATSLSSTQLNKASVILNAADQEITALDAIVQNGRQYRVKDRQRSALRSTALNMRVEGLVDQMNSSGKLNRAWYRQVLDLERALEE